MHLVLLILQKNIHNVGYLDVRALGYQPFVQTIFKGLVCAPFDVGAQHWVLGHGSPTSQ